jgi:hypothetical protein
VRTFVFESTELRSWLGGDLQAPSAVLGVQVNAMFLKEPSCLCFSIPIIIMPQFKDKEDRNSGLGKFDSNKLAAKRVGQIEARPVPNFHGFQIGALNHEHVYQHTHRHMLQRLNAGGSDEASRQSLMMTKIQARLELLFGEGQDGGCTKKGLIGWPCRFHEQTKKPRYQNLHPRLHGFSLVSQSILRLAVGDLRKRDFGLMVYDF